MSEKQHPKDRLREIAERVEAVFSAPSREGVIVAIRELDRRAVHDLAWMLMREKGLRARLQQALRRIKVLEHGKEKTGLRSPLARAPSKVEEEAELRQLSKEVILKVAMDDAFGEDDPEDWFETDS